MRHGGDRRVKDKVFTSGLSNRGEGDPRLSRDYRKRNGFGGEYRELFSAGIELSVGHQRLFRNRI